MARSWFLCYYLTRPSLSDPFRSLIFVPTSLAVLTSLFIFVYISSTSKLFMHHHQHHHSNLLKPSIGSSKVSNQIVQLSFQNPPKGASGIPDKSDEAGEIKLVLNSNREGAGNHQPAAAMVTLRPSTDSSEDRAPAVHNRSRQGVDIHQPVEINRSIESNGNNVNEEVFHDKEIFLEDYKEMNRSFKIYVYPHRKDDPFANTLVPVNYEPGGNYASEAYFKKALMKSHFITKDPSEADLFYMPFSIAALRHDRRVGVGGIPAFVQAYFHNISHTYPYWNRSGGADHFYVACHSIGSTATRKAEQVKLSSIQVVCSSSYFLTAYVAHKDASVPQIWPRKGDPPTLSSSKRVYARVHWHTT
uniref:Exostosin GT47 domain-containing protein n=1 Tax=Nelumbo nucifera TaxID=4432 RepID=A0A822ZUS8_NELNU|nr:TPA_asm: hypothetical protein HUJ06_017042 [Nelumbo nucifera]